MVRSDETFKSEFLYRQNILLVLSHKALRALTKLLLMETGQYYNIFSIILSFKIMLANWGLFRQKNKFNHFRLSQATAL